MTVVSSRVFAENPIHYLNLSQKEEVAIKKGKTIIKLIPEEHDDDPYWDDPRNVAEVKQILKERDEGKQPVVASLKTSEDIQNYMRKYMQWFIK